MSLRSRIAVSSAVAVAIVLVVAGAFIVRLTERDDRATLDGDLGRQAQALSGPLARLTGSPAADLLNEVGLTGIDGDRTVRVLNAAGASTLSFGPPLPAQLGLVSPGASTVTLDRHRYRVYAVAGEARHPLIARRTGAAIEQVQVIAPLAPLEAEGRAIRRRVLGIGVLAVLVIVAMAWLSTSVALTSLRRLREIADEVAGTDDLSRRLEPLEPPEIGVVVNAFNAMLSRLDRSTRERQRALETARAFAADAMHELRTPLTSMGANLEALEARPGEVGLAGELTADHARIVGTLEALHALTVAEVTPAAAEEVDLADLVEVLVGEAPRRHAGLAVTSELPAEPVVVSGSREALRMLVDNLLANAERHGRVTGTTQVRMRVRAGETARWVLTVDDDGAGFPADADRLLRRFERGNPASAGTGLGLAIVDQQARRHGGSVALGASDLGGARVTVTLPRAVPR